MVRSPLNLLDRIQLTVYKLINHILFKKCVILGYEYPTSILLPIDRLYLCIIDGSEFRFILFSSLLDLRDDLFIKYYVLGLIVTLSKLDIRFD